MSGGDGRGEVVGGVFLFNMVCYRGHNIFVGKEEGGQNVLLLFVMNLATLPPPRQK